MGTNEIILAFGGALIALAINKSYSKILEAKKLNRIRGFIIEHCKEIILDRVERYREDMLEVKKTLSNVPNNRVANESTKDDGYDTMPMFTSEILKGYSFEELRRASHRTDTFSDLINVLYSIDFLKKNMCYDLAQKFADEAHAHLKQEGPGHLKTCKYIPRLRQRCIKDIGLKLNTADNLVSYVDRIIANLDKKNRMWLWKYFWT